jgi:hypothetical protein
MIRKLLSSACIAILAAIFLPLELFAQAQAQVPGGGRLDRSVQVVLNSGEDSETPLEIYGGEVEPVGMLPNQAMPFTLQFPSSRAGETVMIGLVDGGQVTAVTAQGNFVISNNGADAPNLLISDEGTFEFSFQPGATAGLYRVLVTVGVDQYQFQLYVKRAPANN